MSHSAMYVGPGEINVVSGPGSQSSAVRSAPPEGLRSPDPAQSQQPSISSWTASTHQLFITEDHCRTKEEQIKDVTIQALTLNQQMRKLMESCIYLSKFEHFERWH